MPPDIAASSTPVHTQLLRVDTHAHVFWRDCPLAAGRRYAPGYEATGADYRAVLDLHAVARAVIVQPSFLGTDNGCLLRAIAEAPERFRGIAVVNPDISQEKLEALAQGGVIGIRLNLIGQALPNLAEQPWRGLFEKLKALGWSVEIQAEREDWVAILPPLLATGLAIVVDHFGRPDAREGIGDTGFQAILRAMETGQVYVKLSAPYRLGEGDWQAAAQGCAAALLNIAGPDRLLWGSDWPWTQFEAGRRYASCLGWLEDWVPDPAAQRVILADTPARLFGFTAKSTAS